MSDDPVLVTHALVSVGAGVTDIGHRDHNEDQVLLRPELGLFLLADGAGGHNAGNVASALATTTVANVFETSAATMGDRPEIDDFGLWTMARRLATAIQRANAEVIDVAKKTAKYQGMGTTLVALAFAAEGDVVHVAHVGDSRCYRLRGGLLDAITVDHSLVVDVLETHPDIDDALLATMPRHVVTRALGMEESVRVSVQTSRVLGGDVYLLCSDGLSGALDDGRIEELLGEALSPEKQVKTLIDAALKAGAEDNIAAVVVACEETAVVPKRRPVPHLEPPPRSISTPRHAMGSAPEIVIVGVESHVVPSDSATAGLLHALGHFARLGASSAPDEVGRPKPSRCVDCGQPLEPGATACPTCGRAAR